MDARDDLIGQSPSIVARPLAYQRFCANTFFDTF
jgi:hypothetical protein